MLAEYSGILVVAFLAASITAIFIWLTSVLGPKRLTPAKAQPYECGQAPFESPKQKMPIHFYLIAMLFIIFDVEIAFLFPWAVKFRQLGVAGLVEIAIFVGLVLIGYVYALKKGALEAD